MDAIRGAASVLVDNGGSVKNNGVTHFDSGDRHVKCDIGTKIIRRYIVQNNSLQYRGYRI